MAKEAKEKGETRWRFWFQDAGYLNKGTNGSGMKGERNRGQQRADANDEAARRAMDVLTGKCAEEPGRNAPSLG